MRTRDGGDQEPGGVELRVVASPPPSPMRAPGPAAWKRREVARLDDGRRARDARLRREAREAETAEWGRTHPPSILEIRWKRDPLAYRFLCEERRTTSQYQWPGLRDGFESSASTIGYEIPNPEVMGPNHGPVWIRAWRWWSIYDSQPWRKPERDAVVPASIELGRQSRRWLDSPRPLPSAEDQLILDALEDAYEVAAAAWWELEARVMATAGVRTGGYPTQLVAEVVYHYRSGRSPKEGLPLDGVAARLGYSTGDELAQALHSAWNAYQKAKTNRGRLPKWACQDYWDAPRMSEPPPSEAAEAPHKEDER